MAGFILTIQTDLPGGLTGNYGFGFNLRDLAGDVVIDWGDGTTETASTTGNITHTYLSIGEYDITISENLRRIGPIADFYDHDNPKIIDVKQWGDIPWSSTVNMFLEATNLVDFSATDIPDLSNLINITSMFEKASNFNGDVSNWDISTVTDMKSLFNQASSFNSDINDWDVSNVTNMSRVFYYASSFNQPLNDWDVSSVTDMLGMFLKALAFNQPLNNWDVSNVTNMNGLFNTAESFNQDLSDWCVKNITVEPYYFSPDSALEEKNKPIWGECPATVYPNNIIIDTSVSTSELLYYIVPKLEVGKSAKLTKRVDLQTRL